jgi:hypothetical protein
MITHIVLLKTKKNASEADVSKLFAKIQGLKKFEPGFIAFSGGRYSSSEGLNRGFTHGFVITFTTPKARDNYLDHPEHEKVKLDALALVEGGVEGVTAFDYET